MAPISTKSTYFNVFIHSTLHTKLKEIAPAAPEIRVPETRQIFFFAPNNKSVRKLCSYAPISTKFGAQVVREVVLPKPYISTKFGTICSKIEENMSYVYIHYMNQK